MAARPKRNKDQKQGPTEQVQHHVSTEKGSNSVGHVQDFIICVAGIYISYSVFGILQEQMYPSSLMRYVLIVDVELLFSVTVDSHDL